MIKKISLYIIFLITISATAFANTCDIFEDALIGNESVSYDPFYNINKEILKGKQVEIKLYEDEANITINSS